MDNQQSNWGPIVSVVIALCTAVYVLLKKIFSTVGRDEFDRAMNQLKQDQNERFFDLEKRLEGYHKENRERLDTLIGRRR